MKSVILNAQSARVLHRDKRVVIEKAAAEPPFEMGDILFIREPWYRLKNPTTGEPSGRFTYASDASAEPVAYKWASPVAMPADAIRRYARVSGLTEKAETKGEEVIQSWEIELELIDKRLAEAADAGLPISTADDPEAASTYYTFTGDMTPEDHSKMCAAIEAAGTPDEPSDEEKAELTEEAFDALSALAREERKREIEPRLAEIAARLEVIADIEKSPDQFTVAAIDEALAERAELYEELELLKQEISDPIETTDEGGLSEPDPAPSEEPAEGDTEDEEIGSFLLGKCTYCAREWGVTLEGAPGGGYPTQRTANAAATRLCDCEEAVENRTPIIGVAFAVSLGTCRYCGQVAEVGPHPSPKAADETASEVCSCAEARHERRVGELVGEALDRVNQLFGEPAEELGFAPLAENGSLELLGRVVELIARRAISSATIQVRGACRAKLSFTTKGKIKVTRSETRSYDLEAGE